MEHDGHDARPLSADSLFFFLLLFPHFFRFPELTLTVFPLGLWRWLERFIPAPTSSLPHPANLMAASILMLLVVCYFLIDAAGCSIIKNQRVIRRLKLAIVLGSFTLIILLPTLHEIWLRLALGPETHAHDGLIMVEEAIKKTLEGKDVYSEKFYGTPLEKSGFANPYLWRRLGINTYPALEYFVYLPFSFLVPLPFYVLFMKAIGWFDLRLILVPLYLLFIWLSYRIAGAKHKLIAVQFAALNPFLATFLIEGRNDAMPLAFLAAAALAISDYPFSAQFFLALACLTKQYAWLTVPFFGLYLIRSKAQQGFVSSAIASVKTLWPFWLMFAAGMLPYFLWNPSGFIKGALLNSEYHPIKGIGAFGFGTWVLYFGWVKDAAGKFPFFLIQALVTIPVLLFFFIVQMRRNTVPQLLLGSGIVLLVFFYFSRYFHDSYVGVITALLALAYCADPNERRTDNSEEKTTPALDERRSTNVSSE